MKINSKKILKVTGITLLSIGILLIAAVLSLQLPAVQNLIKNQLVSYLEKKVKTNVELERFYVDYPNNLIMEGLYLQGLTVDTLLYAKKFDVGLNIPKLLKNTIDITSADLQGVRANVVRNTNGSFNFDYFLDAFARKDSQASESKPFIISLDKIKLQDFGLNFIDNQARNDIKLYFKYFDTRVKTFDLDNNSYAVNHINMDGLNLKMQQDLLEEVAENVDKKADSLRAKKPMKLALNGVNLTNFDIDYSDDNSKTYAKILFGELSSRINKLGIEDKSYDLNRITLNDADLKIKMHSPAAPKKAENGAKKTVENNKTLELLLGQIKFNNVKLAYRNTAFASKSRGMDFNNLDFSKLNLDLRRFKIKDGTYEGIVRSAEIKEKNNLDVRKFHTDFAYTNKQTYLKDLYLETSRSVLRDEIVLDYNSMEQLSANPGAVKISANIRDSKVGFADLLNFAPQLRNTTPFNKFPNAIVRLDSRLKGTINDMHISNLQASGLGDLKLALSGRLKNATDPNNLLYDLKIRNFGSSAKTLYQILPKNTIPSNIAIPSNFAVSGVAKGSTKLVDTNLKLASTLGDAGIDALLDLRNKNREKYDIKANLQGLQLGKILQNKDLGIVTGNVVAKGQSFDFAKGSAIVNAKLATFDYKKYRYRNVNLDGKLNRGAYSAHIISHDPNANLNLIASGIYNEKNPSAKVNGSIVKLDLHRLGFYSDPLILAGKINGDFTNLTPDDLNGNLRLQNFAISDTKTVFPIQDFYLEAISTAQSNLLKISSQVADLEMQGKYKLTQIFGAVQKTLNSYYNFSPLKNQRIDPHQHFTFTAKIKDDDLIRRFVPDLKSFETINLTGNYDADSQNLSIDGLIPLINYADNNVENASVKIFTGNSALQYIISADKISTEKMALNKVSANGNIANNLITYNVSTKDSKDVEQFLIAGNLKKVNNNNEVSLNPNGLKLNYTHWTVSPDNRLQFGPRGIWARNFMLSNGGSQISINSDGNTPNSPLNVDLKDFQIETLTEMVKKDSLLAKGTINGNIRLKDLKNNMSFTSNLAVTNLEMYGSPIGDINAKVNSKTAKILDTDITLSGFDNDVRITGDYNLGTQSMDLVADIRKIQMKSVQGFSMNAITNTEGYLSGRLDINGSTSKPSILGTLKFNDVGLEIARTGSNFRHLNDDIRFVSDGIRFDDFNVKDRDGNALVFNGKILTQDYQNFAFDLKLRARDFKAVDSEPDNDKMMYGILAINADLDITGNMDLPKVNGTLAITDNTDYSFVVPQKSPTLKDREGIVEFIDKDQVALNGTLKSDTLDTKSNIRGMDVNVNISLKKEAKLSLIIDKASGDFVKLQGEAELTGGIDPSGKTTLVGVYEVEQGAYEMNFSLINRKFEIQKGSTITWTGEPTSAILDMTAIYKTKAAPIDLVQQQLSEDQLNYYKQRIPINTLLVLKGELMKPEITFDITTDKTNYAVSQEVIDNVETKLNQLRQDESEMNKQVFALLILNRFIGENPFQSQTGISAGTMARQSVSQILSQQLNNIAQDLIEGVDLTFDFNSYEEYSAGVKNARTDLNVNLSKRLLDDRLKISVGSNFGIEGQARQNEQMSNIAGNITADYALSKDGRYTLRAYRKNEYQVSLQGQIIETGLGFVITLDYNEFKDIFRRAKQNRQIKKQQKKVKKATEGVVDFK